MDYWRFNCSFILNWFMFSEKLRTRETPLSVKSINFFNDSQPLLHFCIPLAHHKYLNYKPLMSTLLLAWSIQQTMKKIQLASKHCTVWKLGLIKKRKADGWKNTETAIDRYKEIRSKILNWFLIFDIKDCYLSVSKPFQETPPKQTTLKQQTTLKKINDQQTILYACKFLSLIEIKACHNEKPTLFAVTMEAH